MSRLSFRLVQCVNTSDYIISHSLGCILIILMHYFTHFIYYNTVIKFLNFLPTARPYRLGSSVITPSSAINSYN